VRAAPIDPPDLHQLQWGGLESRCAWDVGANVGQSVGHCLVAGALEVHAFEPAIESFRLLASKFTVEGRVQCRHVALSDQDGWIDLVDDPEKIDTGQLVTANQYPEAASGKALRNRTVLARKGDSLVVQGVCVPPDFVKIDVEGHEWHVLAGMQQVLREHRPNLLIEVHTEDLGRSIYAHLADDHHYSVQTIRHSHYQPGSSFWRSHYWLRARR
jgi:FkbM family methyltransferase